MDNAEIPDVDEQIQIKTKRLKQLKLHKSRLGREIRILKQLPFPTTADGLNYYRNSFKRLAVIEPEFEKATFEILGLISDLEGLFRQSRLYEIVQIETNIRRVIPPNWKIEVLRTDGVIHFTVAEKTPAIHTVGLEQVEDEDDYYD